MNEKGVYTISMGPFPFPLNEITKLEDEYFYPFFPPFYSENATDRPLEVLNEIESPLSFPETV